MAYDKQNFKSGTKLYAKQLNAMDDKLADNEDRLDAYAQAINTAIDKANALETSKIDGAYVENGYLFLTSNGQVVVGNLGPFSGTGGGSGGGSDNDAKLSVKNASGWLSKVVGEGQSCSISINWSSIEDGVTTGNGTVKIVVNNVIKASYDIAQGNVNIDVTNYLDAGANTIKITVTDAYDNSRTINFSVTVAAISLTSTFDSSLAYDGDITFPYTPVGNVNKTMHFKMDNVEIYTFETTSSNRQLTYIIPKQANGSHVLEVYFTASVDGNTLTSNILRYDIICSDSSNENVIITSSFAESTVKQYETVKIDFYVYNPKSLTSAVKLIADGVTVSDMIGVDRTMQSWSYRFDTSGSHVLKIKCGTVEKVFSLTVAQSDVDIEAETNDLELYLTSYGRSNNEATKNVWEFGSISAVMSNFNFVSDGWVLDDDGTTVLRVSGDARIDIPFKMFKDDFRTTGKTIEFEFATRDVLNYDSILFSCISEDRGLEFTAQKTFLSSEQSTIGTQYKENEHCRITFVIEKRSENRLIWVYINGIASGILQYPNNDDFTQGTPVGISIGSNDCTLDIYTIRVYNNSLTRFQVLNNYIADTHNIDLMLQRYNRNNIFDEYDHIVISKLPKILPYLILNAPELPQSKGDKKVVSGQYVDPINPSNSFTFENAEFDVQGTSSAGYARKNYKGKFKGGFFQNGEQIAKYYGTTPTRDRDVYYSYAFSGWTTSSSDYADAEPNALKNITSEKVFYAAYARTAVYYTVRFYNGTTLLETGQYTYGETPSYSGSTPTQGSDPFIGWIPEIAPVTGNVDYKAKFLSAPVLSTKWKTLAGDIYTNNDKLPLYFKPDIALSGDTAVVSESGGEAIIGTGTINNETALIITWDSSANDKIMFPKDCANMFYETNICTIWFKDPATNELYADTSNVTSFQNVFANSKLLTNVYGLELLDLSKCSTFYGLFKNSGITGTIKLGATNNSNSVNLSMAFSSIKASEIDLSNISKINGLSYAFIDASSLTNIIFNENTVYNGTALTKAFQNAGQAGTLDITKITFEEDLQVGSNAFSGCGFNKIILASATKPLKLPKKCTYCFVSCKSILEGLDYVDASAVTDAYYMFSSYDNKNAVLDLSSWTMTLAPYYASYMFTSAKCKKLVLPKLRIVLDTDDGIRYLSRFLAFIEVEEVVGFNNLNLASANVTYKLSEFLTPSLTSGDLHVDMSTLNLSKINNLDSFCYRYNWSNILYITIPATNGNGIANTTSRIYGADETVYYDFSTNGSVVVTVASS